MKKIRLISVVLLAALGLLMSGIVSPSLVGAAGGNPNIAPIKSHPHGMTYSEWAAEWWQWALATPAGVNPPYGGADCSGGQTGHVWFLFGSVNSGDVVERACTVPSGTALFFPLINAAYAAWLNDLPDTRTEEYIRAQVNCSVPSVLEATIDGIAVQNPFQYFEQSPLFDVQLPVDNVFGVTPEVVPELLFSPTADQGYYLFLEPLPPGGHEIHWKAFWTCPPPVGDFSNEVTYSLTVRPGRNGK
jgi:hypothetical protein